jgi:hypothetical protein
MPAKASRAISGTDRKAYVALYPSRHHQPLLWRVHISFVYKFVDNRPSVNRQLKFRDFGMHEYGV